MVIHVEKLDKQSIEMEEQIYDVIIKVVKENQDIKNQWLSYTGIFPIIKPAIQKELGAAVWYVSAVLEHLARTTKTVQIDDSKEERMYYIEEF